MLPSILILGFMSAILFKILYITESRQGQSFIILENWCNGILVKIKPEDRK